MFWWRKRPNGKEVLDAVIEKLMTPEQMEKLLQAHVSDIPFYELLAGGVVYMKAKYSMEKCLELAKEELECLDLENPTSYDRVCFGRFFFLEILKG